MGGDCPVIGTSSAGEIDNGYLTGSVVVSVIASPRLRVRVGVGKNVSVHCRNAVYEALAGTDAAEYFSSDQEHLTEAQAYRKIQKISMDKNKTLKEVAEAIMTMLG